MQKWIEQQGEIDSSESDQEDDAFDFYVLAQKVYCKYTIQTKSTCFLLQLEKKSLVEMIELFKEVFVEWVSREFIALYEIQKQKKHFIKVFNKKAMMKKENNDQEK